MVDLPYGPRSISGRHQVSLPPELMQAVGLTDDDEVFLAPNLDLPGTIVVIPARLLGDVFPGLVDLLRTRSSEESRPKP